MRFEKRSSLSRAKSAYFESSTKNHSACVACAIAACGCARDRYARSARPSDREDRRIESASVIRTFDSACARKALGQSSRTGAAE